ncbi:MAG: ferredoxin--NADP reductase [Thiotrichaceae bacterium]|nr:ferredoxin--NADP reductase [Thiotrichaceae bacterium]PCI13917.1 MAG: ferredoxin--NADP(+) reductase [Thiotrichales bacterium]
MATWVKAQVVGKQHWTARLVSLQFEAEIHPFRAGQFLRCGMDIDGERVGRPYSLINTPDTQPHEIYFNVVEDGLLTPHLASLEAGDEFWVYDGCNGFMVLEELPAAPELWMLATGTGIGPFIAILKTDKLWQQFEQVVLVHAVSNADELTYRELINDTSQHHPEAFHYVPFVSREKVSNTIHGRIPDAVNNGQLESAARLSINAECSHVMLCGNAGMIKDASELLEQKGMTRHRRSAPGHITIEKYY